MEYTVKLFIIPADRAPGGPPEPPVERSIEASGHDQARRLIREQFAGEGYRVRSMRVGHRIHEMALVREYLLAYRGVSSELSTAVDCITLRRERAIHYTEAS